MVKGCGIGAAMVARWWWIVVEVCEGGGSGDSGSGWGGDEAVEVMIGAHRS